MSTSVEGTWQAILIGEVETIDASIPAASSVAKVFAATPGWLFMPGADEADLAEVVARAPGDAEAVERAGRVRLVLDRGGEDDLGVRLQDRVDVHGRLRERAEELRRLGAVDAVHGLLALVHDAGDQSLLEHLILLLDPRAVSFLEGRADVEPHIVTARDLDRAGGQHACAGGRHLEHLVEADARQLAGAGDDARVGGVDAEDVGVDLAVVGAERGGERHGGRVGAAAAERRHLERRRDALEAGDEHDRALVERLVDPARAHLDDLGLAVHGVGDDPRLRAGEGDRLVAEVVDHHRGERARDPLSDRDEHVELARVRRGRDLLGELEQLVGRVPHRGEDADDAMAFLARGDEPRGDPLQLHRVGDGGAAELHHHGAELRRAELRRLGVRVDRRNGLVLGRGHATKPSWGLGSDTEKAHKKC